MSNAIDKPAERLEYAALSRRHEIGELRRENRRKEAYLTRLRDFTQMP
jgi:hypothetical protein